MPDNFELAVDWVAEQLSGKIGRGRFEVGSMEPEFAAFLSHFGMAAGAIRSASGSDAPVGFTVPDETAQYILADCERDRACFELGRFCAAAYVGTGREMPEALKTFTMRLLTGKMKEPKPSRASPTAFRNLALINCALFAARLFGLSLTRNDVSKNKRSACDAVVAACQRCGYHTSFRAVKELCVGSGVQNARLRRFAVAVDDLLDTMHEISGEAQIVVSHKV